MPDFSKVQVKKVALKELTVPQEFSLASEQRRLQAVEQFKEKQFKAFKDDEARRKFVAAPKPDYQKLALEVMPSEKAITVPIKPNFASDSLPKKTVKVPQPKLKDW